MQFGALLLFINWHNFSKWNSGFIRIKKKKINSNAKHTLRERYSIKYKKKISPWITINCQTIVGQEYKFREELTLWPLKLASKEMKNKSMCLKFFFIVKLRTWWSMRNHIYIYIYMNRISKDGPYISHEKKLKLI